MLSVSHAGVMRKQSGRFAGGAASSSASGANGGASESKGGRSRAARDRASSGVHTPSSHGVPPASPVPSRNSGKNAALQGCRLSAKVERSQSVGSHVEYVIQVRLTRGWRVHQRFSAFERLVKKLRASHPTVSLPPLPKKRFLRSFDKEYLAKKRRGLAEFLEALLAIPELEGDPDLATFLFVSPARAPPRRARLDSSAASVATSGAGDDDSSVGSAEGDGGSVPNSRDGRGGGGGGGSSSHAPSPRADSADAGGPDGAGELLDDVPGAGAGGGVVGPEVVLNPALPTAVGDRDVAFPARRITDKSRARGRIARDSAVGGGPDGTGVHVRQSRPAAADALLVALQSRQAASLRETYDGLDDLAGAVRDGIVLARFTAHADRPEVVLKEIQMRDAVDADVVDPSLSHLDPDTSFKLVGSTRVNGHEMRFSGVFGKRSLRGVAYLHELRIVLDSHRAKHRRAKNKRAVAAEVDSLL